jgi:hypothetical protein
MVHVSPDSQYNSPYVEVLGSVHDDFSIREATFSDFGEQFGQDSPFLFFLSFSSFCLWSDFLPFFFLLFFG